LGLSHQTSRGTHRKKVKASTKPYRIASVRSVGNAWANQALRHVVSPKEASDSALRRLGHTSLIYWGLAHGHKGTKTRSATSTGDLSVVIQ
jgi:hypothetical protein